MLCYSIRSRKIHAINLLSETCIQGRVVREFAEFAGEMAVFRIERDY